MKKTRQIDGSDAAAVDVEPAVDDRAMRAELVPKSRLLARVLRHRPELWGVQLDREGWCQVSDLLAGASSHDQGLTVEELLEIVETNDKRRFSLSIDGLHIRAAQGHSVAVDLKLRTFVPPPVLYHGTVRKHLPAIRREGLRPMNRHAVHLSATKEAAVAVGSRRGTPVVLVVDSYRMNRDGHQFQQAENFVWLIAEVPPQYLKTTSSKRSRG
jgi:putative RNA 2'-phosphotransferase